MFAALAAQAASREEDLAALRARMDALRSELEGRQSSAREAREALRASETAISAANRALLGAEADARAARAAMADLGRRREAQERALEANEAALGRVLAARAMASHFGGATANTTGVPDILRLALSGEDLAGAARQLHYLGYVSSAAAQVIETQRAGLAELARLRAASEEKAGELAALEARARADRENLLKERAERQRQLDKLAGEIRDRKKRIQAMAADEARLARIIEELAKLLAARPGAGYGGGAARVERVPEPGMPAGSFASQRGKLRLPVRGEVVAQRKGVFIRAAEGERVRAIGPGRVVYADWMRGFGNLLIVDHGDAYLSVYGNNESLLRQLGDTVASGDALATVGASGGNEETGLYFELRHLGRPFDPLGWVTLK